MKEYFVQYTPLDMGKAFDLVKKELSHFEVINFMQNGDDIEKQSALLQLNELNNEDEAKILVSLLTKQDGCVRELSSYKILEFTEKKPDLFQKLDLLFVDGLEDVVPTVVRNIISSFEFCTNKNEIFNEILNRSKKIILILKDLDGFEYNREASKLYWYLQGIIKLITFGINYKSNKDFDEILKYSAVSKDYTIREKSAKLLTLAEGYEDLKSMLKNDENHYVSRFFN